MASTCKEGQVKATRKLHRAEGNTGLAATNLDMCYLPAAEGQRNRTPFNQSYQHAALQLWKPLHSNVTCLVKATRKQADRTCHRRRYHQKSRQFATPLPCQARIDTFMHTYVLPYICACMLACRALIRMSIQKHVDSQVLGYGTDRRLRRPKSAVPDSTTSQVICMRHVWKKNRSLLQTPLSRSFQANASLTKLHVLSSQHAA